MTRRLKRSDISDEEIIEACRAFKAGRAPTPDVALAHKYPVKLIMAKMRHMESRRILECGVSLRTAWVLADEGKQQ